jgi:hypothetical protein
MGVASEDPLFGLPHHLLHSRYKEIQFFPQSFEGCLLHHVRRSFHPLDNLAGKSLGLPHHAPDCRQQLFVSLLQTLPVRSALGAHHAPNFQNAELHTPAPIAEFGALLPGDLSDPLHRADQDAHAITQQLAVGW